jgi:wobble nucleotide-excising tRNase
MLKKIISVRNLGRFVNSGLVGVQGYAKYTQIFGANGFGKTTLCAVLRSVGANDPAIIAGRTRLGGAKAAAPQVELLFDDKPVKFENGAWSSTVPEVLVFDGHFIADNVHSGDAVGLDQKRNLYRVIVGKEGVGLAVEEERLAAESRGKGTEIKTAERVIQSHVPQGMKLEDFLQLPADAEIESAITSQTQQLGAIREAAQLKARPGLSLLTMPSLPTGFGDLISTTLDGIAEDAQNRVTEHIAQHKMGQHAEAWIAEGMEHITGDDCPFCGQSLTAVALIEAYRRVFGAEYQKLKKAVDDMRIATDRALGDGAISALGMLAETNRGALEFWSRYCTVPNLEPPAEVAKAVSTLKEAALALLAHKAAAPQDAVDVDATFTSAADAYEKARAAVDAYNAAVKIGNAEITAKKAAVAAADVKKEEIALARLNAQKRRHDPKIAPLCTEYQQLNRDKVELDRKKAEVRTKLEEHTQKVIKPYEARINELLDRFNAGFRIAETKPAYPGGVASSTYQIVINNTSVELGDGTTPLDRPSFKNTLSAGDRGTLALAFFLAHLERDPDRTKRIVVFDDPFTSQDSFRRRQTVYEIKKAGDACEQVIVLSHDATFLKQIRDKCPATETATLQLADHRNLGIKIAPCNLDDACRGRAASDMDDLQAFVATGAGTDRDVIRKMRVVLETYCRSTYPASFAADDRLGTMVEKIKKAGDQHPAASIVDELNEINEYTRDHHHGEDPKDGAADFIDATELTGFVKRTLKLVNNLQA